MGVFSQQQLLELDLKTGKPSIPILVSSVKALKTMLSPAELQDLLLESTLKQAQVQKVSQLGALHLRHANLSLIAVRFDISN